MEAQNIDSATTAEYEVAQKAHDDYVAAIDQNNWEHDCHRYEYERKSKEAEKECSADDGFFAHVDTGDLSELV